MKKSNIILIGMPGSGKSTVGVILAKNLGMEFLDTDIVIQTEEQKTLQEIVNSSGHMALREIEERVLTSIDCKNTVIATGGSAAYSHKAMCHLAENGSIVFLDANLEELRKRIHNYETRGLAKRPDQTFQDLFDERSKLYNKYMEISVECSGIDQDTTCDIILSKLGFTENQQ